MIQLTRGYFEGQLIKVLNSNSGRNGRFEFYYGGFFCPDGDGRGHVVSNDGVNIHFWKLPLSEGGRVVIDGLLSYEKLSSHGIQ